MVEMTPDCSLKGEMEFVSWRGSKTAPYREDSGTKACWHEQCGESRTQLGSGYGWWGLQRRC